MIRSRQSSVRDQVTSCNLHLDMNYDAILVVSFGGPESKEEVIPFLENVLRGRNIPRERMLTVAEHYYHFEGKSPINQQTRELIAALQAELERNGLKLPIYWGNRNWHPLLPETLQKDEAGWHPAGAGVCDFGLQFVLGMPAVSRGHCAGAERSWAGRAAKWISCGRSSTIRDSSRPRSSECVTRCSAIPAERAGKTCRSYTSRTAFRFPWRTPAIM